MRHHKAIELLPSLETEKIAASERDELLRHLEECADCREWRETYLLFSDALAGDGVEHPSSEQLARQAADPERMTGPERQSITEHLASCAACRQESEVTAAALTQSRTEGDANLLSGRWASPATSTALRLALAASVVLAVALGFTLRSPEAPDATVARQLSGEQLSGVQVIEAANSISAEFVTVGGDGEVTFRAGESVALSDGFSVGSDTTFRVEIAETPRARQTARQKS